MLFWEYYLASGDGDISPEANDDDEYRIVAAAGMDDIRLSL